MARRSLGMPSDSKESPLSPGSKLDGYELLWPIGEGGMATVWVARLLRKHGFEKLVAIKTILPKFAEDEAFQTMFLDEARIASRIDHTNVAHIHDLGEKDDILYLVMEYVDGDALTRLRKMVNRKSIPFPIGIALRIMADVCNGLHAAHELKGVDGKPLGVVHRDVSPQNILVTTEGASKLIDFGVAKAAGRLTAETHTGYVKGKVQYMAPEQALGKNVDRRADIWAVGAVIYHLVANRPPFEADNQLALLNLLQKGRPPAPLPPSVPITVQDIVKKALTHNSMMRFQTAAEMRAAIEKTGLMSTQEEVAEFARTHMGELAERRRQAISSAIQGLEGTVAASQPAIQTPPAPNANYGYATEPGGASSTQRIDPAALPPQYQINPRNVRNMTGPQPVLNPPDMRIGPPTPQSFAAAPSDPSFDPAFAMTPAPAPLSARRTEPVATNLPVSAVSIGGMTPNAPSATPAPFPGLGVNSNAPTEPLPPPEALYDNAFNDNTNGGGSLGLASISASINTRRPRNVPLIAGGIGGAVLLIGVLALAVSVSRGGGGSSKKLESEFSPLPSMAPSTPVTTPTNTPAPPPVDELPATPPPSETAALDKPVRPTPPTIAPAPAPHPAPPVVAPAPAPKPAPAVSAKKKPTPSGPPGPDGF